MSSSSPPPRRCTKREVDASPPLFPPSKERRADTSQLLAIFFPSLTGGPLLLALRPWLDESDATNLVFVNKRTHQFARFLPMEESMHYFNWKDAKFVWNQSRISCIEISKNWLGAALKSTLFAPDSPLQSISLTDLGGIDTFLFKRSTPTLPLVTGPAFRPFMEFLAANKKLTTLEMSDDCNAKYWLPSFHFVCKIVRATTNIQSLILHDMKWERDEVSLFVEALGTNSTLTSLGLEDNCMCSEDMSLLMPIFDGPTSSITSLSLSGNTFTSYVPWMSSLRTNTSLTSLDLSNHHKMVLSSLEFPDSSIEELMAAVLEIAQILATNKTLRTLNLNACEIENGGVNILARALMTQTTLTSLGLSQNGIFMDEDEDICHAFTALLTSNKTLRTLDLSMNNFFEEGALALANGLEKNITLTSLNLKGCGIKLPRHQRMVDAWGSHRPRAHLDLSEAGKDDV